MLHSDSVKIATKHEEIIYDTIPIAVMSRSVSFPYKAILPSILMPKVVSMKVMPLLEAF